MSQGPGVVLKDVVLFHTHVHVHTNGSRLLQGENRGAFRVTGQRESVCECERVFTRAHGATLLPPAETQCRRSKDEADDRSGG